MFEKYTFKQKLIALGIIFFMLCIAGYKRSFHPLWEVMSEYQQLAEKSESINNKAKNIDLLKTEINFLDKSIGKVGVTKEMVQQEIIAFVNRTHPELSISELQPIQIFSDENINIITNQLDVTGNSYNLLQLAYDFEKKFNFSRIVSLNFYSVRKNNNATTLHLKIIFQNYENNQ